MPAEINYENIYVICTTDHGNLGDHMISKCEIEFLHNCFEKSNIIEVPLGQYYNMRNYLIHNVEDKDLLVMHGGGSVGTYWPKSEVMRQDIMELFPKNMKVIFPQSIFYEDSDEGREALVRSKKAYNSPNVVMVCRDIESYEFSKREFGCRAILTPDIVLSANNIVADKRKKYIMICLRSDKEGLLDDQQKQTIIDVAKASGYQVVVTDTVLKHNVSPADRNKTLEEFFDSLSQAALVITDRLHGMIFSAIAGVSCAVVSNSYFKVIGQYRWIEACKNIHLLDGVKGLTNFVERRSWESEEIVYPSLNNKFSELREILLEGYKLEPGKRNLNLTLELVSRLGLLYKDINTDDQKKCWTNIFIDSLASAFRALEEPDSYKKVVDIINNYKIDSNILNMPDDYYESLDNRNLTKLVIDACTDLDYTEKLSGVWHKIKTLFDELNDCTSLEKKFKDAQNEYSTLNKIERKVLRLATPQEYFLNADFFIYKPANDNLKALEQAYLIDELNKKIDDNESQINYMKNALNKGLSLARVDFRLESSNTPGNSLDFLEISDSMAKLDMPKWMQKENSGYSLVSCEGAMKLKLLCHGNGKIRFELRGMDVRNKINERIPCWLDYTLFKVDQTCYIEEPTSVWHDKPVKISTDVTDGQVVEVEYEWKPVHMPSIDK